MVSKKPLAIAVLTWVVVHTVLQTLSRGHLLLPVLDFYLFYFLASAATACIYLAMWRISAPAPGARLFATAAVTEGIGAVVALAALVVPGLIGLLTFTGRFAFTNALDVLSTLSVVLSLVALVRTRLVPGWVSALRALSLVLLISQYTLIALSYPTPAAPLPSSIASYVGWAVSIAFWMSVSITLLRAARDTTAGATGSSRDTSTTARMVVVVLVMLVLLAGFPPLLLGTVYPFHGFSLDLLFNIAIAGGAYAVLWTVGARLDSRYRDIVTATLADASHRPAVPQGLSDAYSLLLVCMLPFLFYLFVFALYGMEFLITEALALLNAVQFVPTIVLFGLVVIAAGSVWGVAVGLWRLLVPAKTHTPGVELSRDGDRGLWEVVDQVAADSGTRSVDRIWVAPNASIAVWEEGGLGRVLNGKAPRCMTIGLTAVHDMTVAELKGVLRHEFAHFGNRDTAWGSFTSAMTNSLLTAWRATPGGNPLKQKSLFGGIVSMNPAWWVYWLYVRLFFRATSSFSRFRELMADWDAISYAGGPCFANGLTKVIVNDSTLQKWLHETEMPADSVPDVARSVAQMLGSMSPEQLVEAREAAIARPAGQSHAYDTHPEPQARLSYARRAAYVEESCSAESVRDLFDQWAALDTRASQTWLTSKPAA